MARDFDVALEPELAQFEADTQRLMALAAVLAQIPPPKSAPATSIMDQAYFAACRHIHAICIKPTPLD